MKLTQLSLPHMSESSAKDFKDRPVSTQSDEWNLKTRHVEDDVCGHVLKVERFAVSPTPQTIFKLGVWRYVTIYWSDVTATENLMIGLGTSIMANSRLELGKQEALRLHALGLEAITIALPTTTGIGVIIIWHNEKDDVQYM